MSQTSTDTPGQMLDAILKPHWDGRSQLADQLAKIEEQIQTLHSQRESAASKLAEADAALATQVREAIADQPMLARILGLASGETGSSSMPPSTSKPAGPANVEAPAKPADPTAKPTTPSAPATATSPAGAATKPTSDSAKEATSMPESTNATKPATPASPAPAPAPTPAKAEAANDSAPKPVPAPAAAAAAAPAPAQKEAA